MIELDPDSEEMGQLVDRWLESLRLVGIGPRELQRYAERLADAVSYPESNPALVEVFQQFVAAADGGDGMALKSERMSPDR